MPVEVFSAKKIEGKARSTAILFVVSVVLLPRGWLLRLPLPARPS